MFTIYKYTNIINNKIYIGQTSRSLQERAQKDGSGYKDCPRFYNAIAKYGWDNFVVEIVVQVDNKKEADKAEMYYIDYLKSNDPRRGYNISAGGNGIGCMSLETRKIISDKAKQRYKVVENNPMFGKKHSDISKEKMRAAKIGELNPMYGTRWTESQRMHSGTKGKKLVITEEDRKRRHDHGVEIGKTIGLRKCRCIEDNLSFSSITEASMYYSVDKSSICAVLRGRQKTCKGKHFEYL